MTCGQVSRDGLIACVSHECLLTNDDSGMLFGWSGGDMELYKSCAFQVPLECAIGLDRLQHDSARYDVIPLHVHVREAKTQGVFIDTLGFGRMF